MYNNGCLIIWLFGSTNFTVVLKNVQMNLEVVLKKC